jgi:integrase
MPYTIQLTWHEARRCWKKYQDGRTFYLGKGQCAGRSDMKGYQIAWAEWEEIKLQLDQSRMRQRRLTSRSAPTIDVTTSFATDYGKVDYTPTMTTLPPIADRLIEKLADVYVKNQRARAEAGEISPKMYIEYRQKMDDFVGYSKELGIERVDEIDTMTLDAYRSTQLHLMGLKEKQHVSPFTVKKRLQTVSLFIEWLYERELLETLPRNLKRYARIELPKPTPVRFTVEEVQKLFNAASQRTKLYIALGVNCGYTQIDIAKLDYEHIEWDAGVIRRGRSKTEIRQVHKLWPVTLELLKLEACGKATGPILLDENGNPLVRIEIKENGNVTRNDTVRLAFDRVMKKIGMEKDTRRFAVLRKTGADEIEKSFPELPHLASQFLAHAETATKRYYVSKHYELLFKAIDHLDTVFDLKLPKTPPTPTA